MHLSTNTNFKLNHNAIFLPWILGQSAGSVLRHFPAVTSHILKLSSNYKEQKVNSLTIHKTHLMVVRLPGIRLDWGLKL